MTEVITKHFDVWTSVLINKSTAGRGSNGKQSGYGIKKLRELILELAVRGKLVLQDPNDEPACVLLEKIAEEKAELILKGKLKKEKPLPKINSEEYIFEIPNTWEWIRLGDYSRVFSGNSFASGDFNESGGTKVIKITNAGVGNFVETEDYLPIDFGNEFESFIVEKDDLILALTRPYISTGLKISKCPSNYHKSLLNQRVAAIRVGVNVDYTFVYLQSLSVLNLYKNRFGSSGLQPNLKVSDVTELLLPIPPLAEQHRIVAKVDELMALCDQLEQQQTDSNTAHQTLVETLLGALTNTTVRAESVEEHPSTGSSRTEFEEAWQRIAEHFDTLFTTEHSIDQLKQTILQLAVMGKLVPQDHNDEPASVLLEKIAKEKARLVKEGKVKKQNPLLEIIESEIPFELPSGWCFVRLENLCSVITKGSSPKWQGVSYTDDPADVLFITSENVGSYELLLDSKKYVEHKFNEIEPRSILNNGDFLMNIVGASIGRTAIYNIDELANINQAVCLIRLVSPLINSQYLLHFFNAETCVNYMFDKQVDNARANLSMGNIAKFVMPIPPQAEQNRIVAKVDELMALCDALRARIYQAQTTQIHLADAIVEQAVA